VPVISLILGGAMTLAIIIREPKDSGAANTPSASPRNQSLTIHQP
jgi:hypothetical protein